MEHRKSRLSLLTLVITVVATTADPDPQHAYVFGYAPSSPYYGQYGPLPFHYRVNPFIRYPNVSPASIYPAQLSPIKSFAEQPNADASTRGTIRPVPDSGPTAQVEEKEDPFFEGPFIRDNTQVEKIIGGGGVAHGTFPGYAVLVYGFKPFCGGTLITRKHVLTAGHCLSYIWDIFQGYMSGVRIFLNTVVISPLDSKTVVRSVSTYWRHPAYQLAPSQQFYMYDIAVLQLDYEVNRIPRIQLAGSDEENYLGDRLFVYGFGWTGPPNSTYNPDIPYATSNNLRKGTINMVPNVDCANTYGFPELNNTMFICTDGADPCFGDGGAPLLDDWLQVGVSAYNTWTCNISTPAINTRISVFKDWIRYVVDSEN